MSSRPNLPETTVRSSPEDGSMENEIDTAVGI